MARRPPYTHYCNLLERAALSSVEAIRNFLLNALKTLQSQLVNQCQRNNSSVCSGLVYLELSIFFLYSIKSTIFFQIEINSNSNQTP